MLVLSDLQKKFVDGLNEDSNDIFNYICSDIKLSADAHLQIYRSSIFGIKQKSLREIYTVCNKLVGDEFFIAMINEFISQTISRSSDLANYGEDFFTFIQHYRPADCLPYLADVARLEWAWHKLYSAPDAKGIDFQLLEKYYIESPEKVIFLLPPSGTLISSLYPIHQIWEVNQDDFKGDQTIVLSENQTFYYFVWRKGLQMRIDILKSTEWQILDWIKTKLTLDELCTKVCDELPIIKFEEILPHLVSQGWISGFEIAC